MSRDIDLAFDTTTPKCIVVAEVAQAHDGSLGTAHAFIDAVARAGADAIKFQTHIAAAESTPSEPWRVPFSPQDASRYEYWARMEFTERQWLSLAEHAAQAGLIFLSSPFSVEAVELLVRAGVPAWKIASGELSDVLMMDAVLATGMPVWLSSGMSSFAELDEVVDRVKTAGSKLLVMQATTSYPSPPESVGLNVLAELASRYGCPVGLSDHSGTIWPSIAAAVLGARVVEVHVTLSTEAFGPDVSSSVTIDQLAELVHGVRAVERMLANPVDKDASARGLAPMCDLFGKSVVARIDLPAGTVLSLEHVTTKKPGTGIQARRLGEVLGRILARGVQKDALLSEEDLT